MKVPQVPDEDGLYSPDDRFELDVEAKVTQLDILEEAQRRRAEARAEGLEIPTPETLARFLRRKMPQERYLIEDLWPTDGNIMLAAQRKAGKTLTVHNVARSLVDGDPFMDHFNVVDTRRVALLDFEMSARMLQQWLREQGIRNRSALSVVAMRGRASLFRITDDKVRALWARMIEDTGAEVLIVDPLRPILDAIGLSELNEGGPFLQAFDALKAEAGVSEGLISHHHGHGAERASGDSRFEGWPDAIWNYTRQDMTDPDSYRYFQGYGRDVSVDKGMVLMNDSRRLAFKTDIPEEKQSDLMDRLVAWLRVEHTKDVAADRDENDHQHGERNTGQIEQAGLKGISKNTSAEVMRTALRAERVAVRPGPHGAKWYSLPPT